MAKEISRVTARGKHKGHETVIECVEFKIGKQREIKIFKDGKSAEDDRVAGLAKFYLEAEIIGAWLETREMAHLPSHGLDKLWSYWVILHDKFFDEPPAIQCTGEFQPIEEEICGVVF